ncbi:MAG: hypothetical protein Ct9H300mP28_29910 [Pseudomonadota bacterium]|nr:MAG: hypothetical protein Ct9H300mP28_29910 [Pseudomonadota bacterium]
MAGYSEVTGLKGNLTLDLSPGFGYTGIVFCDAGTASSSWRHWFSYFRSMIFGGADAMSRSVGVPNYIADVVVATSLLCMLVSMLQKKFIVYAGNRYGLVRDFGGQRVFGLLRSELQLLLILGILGEN